MGEAKWTGPASQYDTLKRQLDIQNGFLLVTNDQALTKVAMANGCAVRDLHTKP